MKGTKWILSFISLILIGVVISYAETRFYNEYNKLVKVFDETGTDFKFYSIKANTTIDYDISKDEMKDISLQIFNKLGFEEESINWDEKWNDNEKQIYSHIKEENKNISIIGIKKSDKEAYIIVDILNDKVYKNIADTYNNLDNVLNKYSSQVDIYTCIAGEYTKRLQINKYDDILDKILYNMSAEEIDRVEEENFISVTAYSKLLNDNYLEYLGNKINLNIGIRYSEDDEKTLIYIATPIIKLDY